MSEGVVGFLSTHTKARFGTAYEVDETFNRRPLASTRAKFCR